MGSHVVHQQGTRSSPESDEMEVCTLYRQVLDGWNMRSAEAFAAPFTEGAEVIGFDGSQMMGVRRSPQRCGRFLPTMSPPPM